MPWSASDHQRRNFWWYVRSGAECIGQGNDFELISTITMEIRHPVVIYFGREFPAICYHCGSSGGLKSPEVGNFRKIFAFFGKNDPLWFVIMFSKFCSESLHRDTDRRCCVQNSWKLSDGKSVKSCVIYLTNKQKQNLGSLSNSLLRKSRPKSAVASPHWLTTFQISSKSVHLLRSYSRPHEGRFGAH